MDTVAIDLFQPQDTLRMIYNHVNDTLAALRLSKKKHTKLIFSIQQKKTMQHKRNSLNRIK